MSETFIFDRYKADLEQGVVSFTYKLYHGKDHYVFTEKLHVPQNSRIVQKELLDAVLQSVHLALGISYWKLYCPRDIRFESYSLSKDQAAFWKTVYTKGLGEFYFQNKIDFRELINVPFDKDVESQTYAYRFQNRSLVGIGGGKDSIVTAELLKKQDKPFDGFIVETQQQYPLIDEVTAALNIRTVKIQRTIDFQLFQLNEQKDVWNGHVPVSCLYAFIGIMAAVLYDYAYVIVSNEQTANSGNLTYLGETINHQWSKSSEFEGLLQKYIRENITPDSTYFSLLRPFTELKIVELFSQMPFYHLIFSSCNTNFRIHKTIQSRWCGSCAKCAFVFALCAAYLSYAEIMAIFGSNYFEKPELLPLYKKLLGTEGIKPFECVGTPEEVKVAFLLSHKKGAYDDSLTMQYFINEVLGTMRDPERMEKHVLTVQKTALIPDEFQSIISYS